MNKDFRASYNAHIKMQNDRISREANAKKEGIAIGKEEGKAEGELKGKRETASAMLAEKLPLEIISKCTGLSIDEIKTLQK
jgi:predicted transposase/invertase (TIGR01784 family)